MVEAALSQDRKYVITLDIGGTNVRAALVSSHKTIDPKEPFITAVEQCRTYDEITDILKYAIESIQPKTNSSLGAGISMPGPFDFENGIAWMRDKLHALYGRNLKQTLEDYLRLPVHFLNDAEAFALGAWWMFPGLPKRLMVVTLGTGLGACFLVDGVAIRSGEDVPQLGEIWDVPYRGGILEDFISRRTIEQLYNGKLKTDPSLPAFANVKEIAESARSGNEAARVVFQQFGINLGTGIAPHVKQFRPGIIVLGGQITKAFDLFGSHAQGVLDRLVGIKCTLIPTSLGDATALMGAGYYCLKKLHLLNLNLI